MRRLGFLIVSGLLLAAAFALMAQTGRQKVVILLLGPPGSGKTTQANNLSQKYKVPAYSMAAIFKKESGWVKDKYKKSLGGPMATGDILGDELSNQLVEKYIVRKKARNGFILDGYPRTLKQARFFANTLTALGLPEPVVIHLTVPDAVAIDRMQKRGARQDTPETIQMRMEEYHAERQFLLSHYKDRLRTVDGTPSRSEVWNSIEQVLKEYEN